MSSVATYELLVESTKRLHSLGTVAELLGWDEQVNLPPGAAEQRAAQRSALAGATHAVASDPRLGEWLSALEADATLTTDQRIVVKEARRDYDLATKLPADFVREKAAQGSRGYHAWVKAKADDDFAGYAPVLAQNLALAKREAEYLGWGDRSYDYMIDKNDPGMTAKVIAGLFDELKRDLVPLVREIAASPVTPRPNALMGSSEAGQRAFLQEVTTQLGFDYSRGRIDESLHPFCSGTGSDVRLTTRFKAHEPLDALFSSIHESGHGMYEQGLAEADLGTALGIHAGMAVHESQSRLWENQVARSRGFWRCFEPRLRATFPAETASWTSDELYLAINAVTPTLIRVESDEVTYNLHIILRFEIEQRLFSGELAMADVSRAWADAAESLLGMRPTSDRDGVLQDVHWSDGAFGYFPSYCLGNMFAAQLWYRALELRPTLEEDFARGDFSWLVGWLRETVHVQGRRYDMLTLCERATGEALSPRHLVRYLRERYGSLYL